LLYLRHRIADHGDLDISWDVKAFQYVSLLESGGF